MLDLTQVDKRLTGFYGGFSTTLVPSAANGLSSNYAYLSPYKNIKGPIDGINTKYTADGFKFNNVFDEKEAIGGDHLEPSHHGLLTRINLDTFAAVDVQFIDLEAIDPDLKGFAGGFQGGRHGYLTPYSKGFNDYASKVVRFDLLDFAPEKVEVLDFALKNEQVRAYEPRIDEIIKRVLGLPLSCASTFVWNISAANSDAISNTRRSSRAI